MSLVSDRTAPSGLEVLRAMMAERAPPPIATTLGFALVEVDEGRAVFTATPQAMHYNPIGSVHGGFAATLLDSACGCAVHSTLRGDQGYTTLELKVSYLRPMTTETGPIRTEGAVISVGRRAAFAEARIIDANGRVYATATSTLLVFDR